MPPTAGGGGYVNSLHVHTQVQYLVKSNSQQKYDY